MTERSYWPCRTYGHAWMEVPAERPATAGHPLWLRCERCQTVRIDVLDRRDAAMISRRYEYPDGYRKAVDEEPMTRQDFRLLLIRQRIEESRAARRMRAVQ